MTSEELNEILYLHKLWLDEDPIGKQAEMNFAKLQNADIQGANLQYANLQHADMQGANLKDANLQHADLKGANLKGASMEGANLKGANIDYSCWPLWCYSLDVTIDESIAAQLLYHWMRAIESVSSLRKFRNNRNLIALANKFHRVYECRKLEKK